MPAEIARLNDFYELVQQGLSKVHKDDLPTHPKLWTSWLTEKKAKAFVETHHLTTNFGPMPQKGVGGIFTIDRPLKGQQKSFTIVPYGLAFVAEYELIRWDLYGVFTDFTKKLTRSGVYRQNVVTHAPLNNAFSTADSVYTTYSNEALCSSAHVLLRGGTGKNAPTVPTSLSYLGMQEALTDFALLVNEDGLFVMLEPKTVLVHPSRDWVAATLLKSAQRPGSADNDTNTLKDRKLNYDCSPFLTSQTAWFLLASKQRLAESMTFDIGDDWIFKMDYSTSTWDRVFALYASFRIAVMTWYGLWGSQG